jgi:hypothetical protein
LMNLKWWVLPLLMSLSWCLKDFQRKLNEKSTLPVHELTFVHINVSLALSIP